MHQLHDADVAQRLLYHLARVFGCPDAVYKRDLGKILDRIETVNKAEGGPTGPQDRVPNSGKTISRRKALRALDRLHGEVLS
jgi:hypothetical protein